MIQNELSKSVRRARAQIKAKKKAPVERMQKMVSEGISNELIRTLAMTVLERATAIQHSISTGRAKEKLLQLTQRRMGWEKNEGETPKAGLSPQPKTSSRARPAKKNGKKVTKKVTKKVVASSRSKAKKKSSAKAKSSKKR